MGDAVMTPEKARLYKTACFTDQARKSLADGSTLPTDPVRIVFSGVVHNAMFKVDEPVFMVYRTTSADSFIGHYFARALKDFVL